MPSTFALFACALLLLNLPAPATAQQPAFGQYPIPTSRDSEAEFQFGLTQGPDGALWFTQGWSNQIGRITAAGAITSFAIPSANSRPGGITAGPDGALWFTASPYDQSGFIGRITTAGVVTDEYKTSVGNSPGGITAGPDGAIWFIGSNQIGRITTAGVLTEYDIPTANSGPVAITTGPDGALWFTEGTANQIGRLTTTGRFTEYELPGGAPEPSGFGPHGITAGPDGALWFTESNQSGIGIVGRITTTGVISEFTAPAGVYGASLGWITAGPDRALWYTDQDNAVIGRVTTDGAITTFPSPAYTPDDIIAGPDGELWFTGDGGYLVYYGFPLYAIGEFFINSNAGLNVTPNAGFYGTRLAFTGSGFDANETVQVFTSGVGSEVLASAAADASGAVNVSAIEPTSVYGARAWVAVGQTSHKLGAASFMVTPHLFLSPNSGPPGTAVTVGGTGFASLAQVNIYWDQPRILLGAVTADANGTLDGSAALTFNVPAGAVPGVNDVQGVWSCLGGCNAYSGFATFTVQ